ncbi:hypothetical protein SACE_2045 [Saccharopolyspora erythraea NRRL 2338]|uniref:Uncharacterized protein n=2 Tax=Saccharopolyspora erythraea TaxID=1836 RepID=A4FBC6_SACEN|nr:hypothetical protein N599_09370 [Saccharopolyspora erythraea D]QRK93444.1 hypothetical protein JQX30_10770 [Saccharopolyspora erythraea]CAM01351.1 hypothetical protein SACE_2045 [Saccharopolyspora erythraea NRRL 2338]
MVLLTVLGPLQSSASSGPVFQSGSSKSETEKHEHREGHKLRERLPGIALHRRAYVPRELGRRPLPHSMQHGIRDRQFADQEVRYRPRLAVLPEERVRSLHSPALLQVFRH